jgi:hypothetical protein
MVAMPPSRLSLIAIATCVAACGSSVEDTSSGAGGASPTTATSTASSGGGQGQAGGGAGGCQPWEECTCVPCDEQGGTCLMRCNFGAGYECFAPGPPTANEFSCGGFENCDRTEACIDVEQGGGDSCIDHFCAALPDACADDRTCACLAEFIDDPIFATGPGACTDAGGEIHVTYAGGAPRPPWDEPWCGSETCAGDDVCWACSTDGDASIDTWLCAATDPGPDGSPSCHRQWGEG